jgi:hypothetical protein
VVPLYCSVLRIGATVFLFPDSVMGVYPTLLQTETNMIINTLTEREFERIITPILKLEDIEVVKRTIYEVFHIFKYDPTDKKLYGISADSVGVYSSYIGFEIVIRRLNDPKNGYRGVNIEFRKKRRFIDSFINPNNKMVRELKRMCGQEITQASFQDPAGEGLFRRFDPGPPPTYSKYTNEEFWYQFGTLNPNWKNDDILSPLTIFTGENGNEFLTNLVFAPECYQREANKTVLKEDWVKILEDHIADFSPWRLAGVWKSKP